MFIVVRTAPATSGVGGLRCVSRRPPHVDGEVEGDGHVQLFGGGPERLPGGS